MDPSQQGGQQPYQPYPPSWQQPFTGYPVPPVRTQVNGLSVASLVLGIVCCLPPLGMIFGFIALAQIRKKGERGRGMAIAGTILSGISTLLLIVMLATGGFGRFWEGVREGIDEASQSRSTLDLRKGDCFNVPGSDMSEERETTAVAVVDCDDRHEAEISGDFEITGFDDYPGESRLDTLAGDRCPKINNAYAMDPWGVPRTMEAYYYLPTEESWRLGDSAITCGFASADGSKVVGSLRRDATGLDTHQLTCLRAESALTRAEDTEPVDEFPDDAEGHRDWARATSAALAAQARVLKEHDWPTAAAGPAGLRAKEFETARGHWDKAARARDEDTFWDHALDGQDALAQSTEIAVRGPLALPTEPPADDDEG